MAGTCLEGRQRNTPQSRGVWYCMELELQLNKRYKSVFLSGKDTREAAEEMLLHSCFVGMSLDSSQTVFFTKQANKKSPEQVKHILK